MPWTLELRLVPGRSRLSILGSGANLQCGDGLLERGRGVGDDGAVRRVSVAIDSDGD